ncbi:hypothetical protein CVU76_02415 [Candidatus Dojkabacteria bacterium HGW-Dojkabacteria-1]|uniref:DUF218 domain-containing protein n=1 Tax=Candidatus Dojkabacteria bacterium HGW-Dojkabacteria-1 TaxID=2013761 RepID=A0A2N2F3Q8_9BACT|nr:MAG: hypothetical protein CVU76_02415 [Candidatus Dojkabacteria bacterium HGW-Dojkabacteria-1]
MPDIELDQDVQVDTKEPEVPVSLSPVLTEIGYTLLIPTTLEQKESLEKLLGSDTQVIRILAAGTKEQEVEGILTWQSPGFEGTDNNGLCSGGAYRVAAGAIAMRILPEAKAIVGSKYANDQQPAPSIVMKEELKMLGLDEERILSDPDTLDTIAELVRLVEICEENEWNHGVCITNEYHCARVQALLLNLSWLSFPQERTENFLKGLESIKNGELNIRVVSAEEVIKKYDEEIYRQHLEGYLDTPMIHERKANERKGVNLVAGGQYSRYQQETNERKILSRSDNPPVTLT